MISRIRYFQSTLVLTIILSLASCSDETTTSIKDGDIFIAGSADNGKGISTATYWHNGSPVHLTSTVPNFDIKSSSAKTMTVSGNDVYVCGVLWTSLGGGLPVYWKNGEPVVLGQVNDSASDVAVVGNDVYVAGGVIAQDGSHFGVLWKNGVINYLTEEPIQSVATGTLLVSGDDVYIGGCIIKDGKTYAVYWKNGTPHFLTSGDSPAYVHKLALDGDIVYSVVYESSNGTARYYKNEQVIDLTDGSSYALVHAICVNDGDVYVAGTRVNGVTTELLVWKNNNIIEMPQPYNYEPHVGDIAIKSNDILVAGSMQFIDEHNNIYTDAALWTNGIPERLQRGSDGINQYTASSIEVHD